jgi:hypothetical protein
MQDQLTFLGVLEMFNCSKTYLKIEYYFIIIIIVFIVVVIYYHLYSGYLLLHT